MRSALSILCVILISGTQHDCRESTHKYIAFDRRFSYSGRIDGTSHKGVTLISSAASVTMEIGGNTCVLFLQNDVLQNAHNYFSLEIDGIDQGRYKIEGNVIEKLELKLPEGIQHHHVSIFKATEPSTGNIIFCGVQCSTLFEMSIGDKPKIEFIGNSITCGMSAYPDEIPCGEGVWYDQHNAYCSYASRIARALDAEYMLSAASGCGIYRHWNRNHPTLPEIYEQTYLNYDTSRQWDFSLWIPDIVSICLGTNDLSDGDGITPRDPFDSIRFSNEYVQFLKRIYKNYPEAQVVLLSSPMLNGNKARTLSDCLLSVKEYFDRLHQYPSISIFLFENYTPRGCGYHPNCDDHRRMADELLPLFQELTSQ